MQDVKAYEYDSARRWSTAQGCELELDHSAELELELELELEKIFFLNLNSHKTV